MKNTKVINSKLCEVISKMGHTQTLTIGDSGLPIDKNVERIDLALTHGVPTFLQVLDNVLLELCVEKVYLANEIKTKNPEIHAEIVKRFDNIEYLPHEDFKVMTKESEAVVRSGEITPYANIILQSGVVF